MINIRLNEDGAADLAYILASDLRAGRKTIYLGGNIPRLNREMTEDPINYMVPIQLQEKINQTKTPGELILHEDIEGILVHETTHIVIFDLTASTSIVRTLDNIDNVGDRLVHFPSYSEL